MNTYLIRWSIDFANFGVSLYQDRGTAETALERMPNEYTAFVVEKLDDISRMSGPEVVALFNRLAPAETVTKKFENRNVAFSRLMTRLASVTHTEPPTMAATSKEHTMSDETTDTAAAKAAEAAAAKAAKKAEREQAAAAKKAEAEAKKQAKIDEKAQAKAAAETAKAAKKAEREAAKAAKQPDPAKEAEKAAKKAEREATATAAAEAKAAKKAEREAAAAEKAAAKAARESAGYVPRPNTSLVKILDEARKGTQTYDDIAAVTGLTVTKVKHRMRQSIAPRYNVKFNVDEAGHVSVQDLAA